MFRIKIAMIIGGGVLAFFGIQEFRVSSGTSSAPEEVQLLQLEGGQIPENSHLKVGPHYAIYAGSIYEYEESKYSASSTPSNSAKVNVCYYPIVSKSHPFVEAVEREDDFFEFDQIAGLVKTKRFKKIGSIPEDLLADESNVQGLVVNRVDSLDKEEKKLLKENFPKVDIDRVLILEEGRQPSSLLKSGGMIMGGLALIAVGIGLFFVGAVQ